MAFVKVALFILFVANCNGKLISYNAPVYVESAASLNQIKYAIEQKYDDTGPGAKGKEYAYKTFKTAEEAARGFSEGDAMKNKMYFIPTGKMYSANNPAVDYSGFNPVSDELANDISGRKPAPVWDDGSQWNNFASQYTLNQVKPRRPVLTGKLPSNRLALGSIGRLADEIEHNPNYVFSYGVHDRLTGDVKSQKERRFGDTVTGYYTVLDPDGQQRTVQYDADDKLGFRALVHRTPTFQDPRNAAGLRLR